MNEPPGENSDAVKVVIVDDHEMVAHGLASLLEDESDIRVRKQPDPPRVVMITSVVDRRLLNEALDAGCCGFVSKSADRRDLFEAVLDR